jgi:hypothetical protein
LRFVNVLGFGAATQAMIDAMSTGELLACPDFMRLPD